MDYGIGPPLRCHQTVETGHHLIVTHEVTNVGTDRSQLAHLAKETKAALDVEKLDVVADRGYFSSEEILACEKAGAVRNVVGIRWRDLR
jgi:hypothetical protein